MIKERIFYTEETATNKDLTEVSENFQKEFTKKGIGKPLNFLSNYYLSHGIAMEVYSFEDRLVMKIIGEEETIISFDQKNLENLTKYKLIEEI